MSNVPAAQYLRVFTERQSIHSIAKSGPYPSDQIAAPGKTENI
jgi:hypothetical protein